MGELSGTQKKIISLYLKNAQISTKNMAEQLGMSSRGGVEKNIKKLKEQGILIRHGSPKSGYWEVCLKDNE